jgi:predicted esterase
MTRRERGMRYPIRHEIAGMARESCMDFRRGRIFKEGFVAISCGLLLGLFLLSLSAIADDSPAITQHESQIGDNLLKYTAEVGRIAISNAETGEPHGYMFYTAYRAASTGGPRPVTFVWNGGPGADSSLLHFSVVGPKLAQGNQLVDNPDSWLSVTDIVMVDPIGTGFSRPTKSEYGAEFYGTVGDVNSVTEFVRAWRLLHGAEGRPLFLAGESWGAGRAAHVAYALEKRGITVDGILLISGGWGLNKEYISPQLRAALPVVDMASAALYYHKTPSDLGTDPAQVRTAAEKWVRESYAPALERSGSLSESERSVIVAQLSRFIGLSPEQIDKKTLTITPRQFRAGLLKDQNKEPYVFDLRRSSAPESKDASAILRYFRNELGYHTSLLYLGIEKLEDGFAPNGTYPNPVNEQWNYATAKVTPEEAKAAIEEAGRRGEGPPRLGPPLPGTEEALAMNPRMKVFVVGGMYDSFLPCSVGDEIERELPANLRNSLEFKCYVGGHAMYKDDSTRTEFSHDVKAWIERSR